MPSSRALRQRFSRTGLPSRRSARSMNSSMPAPNSREKRAINFWSMNISPKIPTAPIQPGSRPSGAEVQIWGQSVLEGNGVHQQDAQHRHAADEVKAGDSRRFRRRTGFLAAGHCLRRRIGPFHAEPVRAASAWRAFSTKRRILRRSFLPMVSTPLETSTPQGRTMLMARPTLAGSEAAGQQEVDTPRPDRDAATSRLKREPGAALYAFNQPVQRHEAAGVGVLMRTRLGQLRHVVRGAVGRRNVDYLDNLAVHCGGVFDALLARRAARRPGRSGRRSSLTSSSGWSAKRPTMRGCGASKGAHRVNDVPGVAGGDAAAALRHEDHAHVVGPGLRGRAGVGGVADAANLDPYHTWACGWAAGSGWPESSRTLTATSGAVTMASPTSTALTRKALRSRRSAAVKMPLSLTTTLSPGSQWRQALGDGQVGGEGVQVAVVDADDFRAGVNRRFQLAFVVDFDKALHSERLRRCQQFFQQRRLQDGDDEQDAVGSGGTRLIDLVGVKDEVLAQHRGRGPTLRSA